MHPRAGSLYVGYEPRVYSEEKRARLWITARSAPSAPFEERELSVEECAAYLQKAIDLLKQRGLKDETSEDANFRYQLEGNPATVSPIRYAKYGYHGSQLSKATLQLAADRLVKANAWRGELIFRLTKS